MPIGIVAVSLKNGTGGRPANPKKQTRAKKDERIQPFLTNPNKTKNSKNRKTDPKDLKTNAGGLAKGRSICSAHTVSNPQPLISIRDSN